MQYTNYSIFPMTAQPVVWNIYVDVGQQLVSLGKSLRKLRREVHENTELKYRTEIQY